MSKDTRRVAGSLALTAIAAGAAAMLALAPGQTDAQNRSASADAQFTAEGTERCLFCHAAERMELMAETAHGNVDNPHSPYAEQGCESCHGPGSLHVSRARGGIGQPPLLQFGADHPLPEQSTACLACHDKDMGELPGLEWQGSAHDTEEIACTSCHELHQVGNPLADRGPQTENCNGCHEDEIREHSTFEDVGIVFDRLMCVDCHDVHNLTHDL